MKIEKVFFITIFIIGFFVLNIQASLFETRNNLDNLLSFSNIIPVQADVPSDYVNVGGKVWCTLPDGEKAPVQNARFDIEGYAGQRLEVNDNAKYVQNDQVSNELGRWKTTKVGGFWRIKFDGGTSIRYLTNDTWQSFSTAPAATLTQCSTTKKGDLRDGGQLPSMIDNGDHTCKEKGDCPGTNGQNSFFISSGCNSDYNGRVYSVCNQPEPAYYCWSQGRGEVSYLDFDLGTCPEEPVFQCVDLTSSQTTYEVGTQVSFTCNAEITSPYTLKYYNYRVQEPGSSDWDEKAEWQNLSGATPTYTVPASGSYKVQCQVCREPVNGEAEKVCTSWGQANPN